MQISELGSPGHLVPALGLACQPTLVAQVRDGRIHAKDPAAPGKREMIRAKLSSTGSAIAGLPTRSCGAPRPRSESVKLSQLTLRSTGSGDACGCERTAGLCGPVSTRRHSNRPLDLHGYAVDNDR